jgi:hypothetical protein
MIAAKAAELLHKVRGDGSWKTAYKKWKDDGIRNRLKFDALIAATAIVRNVDYLYTEDDGLINLCKDFIGVGPIPAAGYSPQLNIFKQSEKLSKQPADERAVIVNEKKQ